MATAYLHEIYSAELNLDSLNVVRLFEPLILEDDKIQLCVVFSDGEMTNALFQLGTFKDPGPYGFPARFCQRNWDTVKDGIVAVIKEVLITWVKSESVKDTTIVLIPEIVKSTKHSNFRPISLCKVIYKVVLKCLVNIMMPLLDDIISPD